MDQILKSFFFSFDNFPDIETQKFKIRDYEMEKNSRFRDSNFKLREFETRLIVFEDCRFW